MREVLVDVCCVGHVHSTCSDGTATVAELVADAADAGADALLLTDHDSLGARGWEGRDGEVVVLVGTEVSAHGDHYLAFGVDRKIPHAGLSAVEIAESVGRLGASGSPRIRTRAAGRCCRRRSPGTSCGRAAGRPLEHPRGCDAVAKRRTNRNQLVALKGRLDAPEQCALLVPNVIAQGATSSRR